MDKKNERQQGQGGQQGGQRPRGSETGAASDKQNWNQPGQHGQGGQKGGSQGGGQHGGGGQQGGGQGTDR